MAAETLNTLDAILAGLHTLATDAETVGDDPLRQRLSGAIVGLRSAVLTARGQVLQLQDRYQQLVEESRQSASEPASQTSRPPRMKWGCYQFDDAEGLFCAACYDKRNRRIRTMRYNS